MIKKIYKIILYILIICLLSGCSFIYNLTNFIVPDDAEFLAIIENLNTPEKICAYMEENFEWEFHLLSYSPYQMWLANIKKKVKVLLAKIKAKVGDCNDMSCFAVFCANWHGYSTNQIWVFYKDAKMSHFLGVFVVNGKYDYSSNYRYYPIQVDTFEKVVTHHIENWNSELKKYRVYDYNMNLVEMSK